MVSASAKRIEVVQKQPRLKIDEPTVRWFAFSFNSPVLSYFVPGPHLPKERFVSLPVYIPRSNRHYHSQMSSPVFNNSPSVFWCELSQLNQRITQTKYRLQRAEDPIEKQRLQVQLHQLLTTKSTLKHLLHEVHEHYSKLHEETRQRSRSAPESIALASPVHATQHDAPENILAS